MPELPADFDLKLMPDWLKEPATKNPYADYEGRDDDRRSRGRDDWGGGGGGRGRQDDRRGKPGGGQRPGARRDDRSRKDAPAARKADAPGSQKPGPRRPEPGARADDRRGRPGDQPRRDDRRGSDSRDQHAPQTQPANVTIEFFPDEGCAVSIGRQVKSTHRAYSLFDLARMFLARPERHRLKITTKAVAEPLFQVGDDGPVWADRAAAERAAFPIARHKLYIEVTEQKESPKGNFTNVARCRANGMLLGPTNYHGYQPALRRLFEERFSRRMSFADFQREIEVVNDPALVEQWKQQASSVTVYRLKPAVAPEDSKAPAKTPETAATEIPAEEKPLEPAAEGESPPEAASSESQVEASAENPPAAEEMPAAPAQAAYESPVFNSLAEVEQHFRQTYLPALIRAASSFHLSGEASRSLSDHSIAAAVRQAWEQERGFPGQMMHQLRQQFSRSGLHIFKHRKRMQFVSLIRPSPMENGSLSASVAEILQAVQASQNCNRSSLAASILGADESAVDPARKATLATDLRWLIETGRVIEFSDGRLELPVAPAKTEPGKSDAPAAKAAPAETPATPEAIAPPEISPAPLPTESLTAPPAPIESLPETEPAVAEPEATIAEPEVRVEQPVTAPAESTLPEIGYQPAEPIHRIPPAEEQEPTHVAYLHPAGQTEQTPEPAVISAELPVAES